MTKALESYSQVDIDGVPGKRRKIVHLECIWRKISGVGVNGTPWRKHNASTRVLDKRGFQQIAEFDHPQDGKVWGCLKGLMKLAHSSTVSRRRRLLASTFKMMKLRCQVQVEPITDVNIHGHPKSFRASVQIAIPYCQKPSLQIRYASPNELTFLLMASPTKFSHSTVYSGDLFVQAAPRPQWSHNEPFSSFDILTSWENAQKLKKRS